MLRSLASSDEPTSFANKFRARRFLKFEALVAGFPRPLRILDLGGTNAFWENRGWHERTDVEILTLNLVAEEQRHGNIKPLTGDATNLAEFAERSIDVVFSNSVIEHLFTFENQRRMASEVQRVGKAFWVQTPNFWFPLEPHFHFIGWAMASRHRAGVDSSEANLWLAGTLPGPDQGTASGGRDSTFE